MTDTFCWEVYLVRGHHFPHQQSDIPPFFCVIILQSVANLAKAFENGFDNYSTVRGDPDLDPIKQRSDFIKLMDSYETKGFNPFGFFGKK